MITDFLKDSLFRLLFLITPWMRLETIKEIAIGIDCSTLKQFIDQREQRHCYALVSELGVFLFRERHKLFLLVGKPTARILTLELLSRSAIKFPLRKGNADWRKNGSISKLSNH